MDPDRNIEGGELHEGSASSVRLSVMKFPRLSHDAIPNAAVAVTRYA